MANKNITPPSRETPEHHLVAEFRRAIEKKDLVTMGRMLELLGTMRAELMMGKPVIDKLAATKKASGPDGAPSQATKAHPKGSLLARLQR
jgi:hypothetical protein